MIKSFITCSMLLSLPVFAFMYSENDKGYHIFKIYSANEDKGYH
ncbi:hypothetical protein [Silvanigrella aquatica]|nr:hypothetical protein [Silvanigrella aquatica]